MMLEFARQHFPETLAETENKYNDIYQKRHQRFLEKMATLQDANIVETEFAEIVETEFEWKKH